MYVAFRHVGEIEVDDEGDPFDVDSPRRDVSRHEHPGRSATKSFERALAGARASLPEIDDGGKRLIQEVVKFADGAGVRHRVVFLPDYDMALARVLCAGADVWLNNPLRPLEACGTSGMKAALNGVLNLSILDGWWAEAYSPAVGFAIAGEAPAGATEEEQDEADADALFAVLEEHVIPAFYEHDAAGMPPRWIALMRESIAELGPRFGTARMVAEYVERLYLPAHDGALNASSRGR